MFRLELVKLKRRKIGYLLPLVVIVLFLLEWMIGNQLYQGHRYGSVNGWYLENGFFFLNYYFLLPLSSLILVDLIGMEDQSKTITSLRLIPVDLKQLLQTKFLLTLFATVLLSEFTFCAMLLLEMMDGEFTLPLFGLLSWFLGYGVIALADTFVAGIVVLVLGKYGKPLLFALPLAFLLAFAGLFALSTNLGQYYLVNLPLLLMKGATFLTVLAYAFWLLALLVGILYFLFNKEMKRVIFAYK